MSITNDQIQKFYVALRDAVHDKKREVDRSLRIYYDADAVAKSISGLTNIIRETDAPDLGDAKTAVRALIFSGALGEIRLLRPHLLELQAVLAQWPRQNSFRQVDEWFRLALLRKLAQSWGLIAFSNRILEIRALEPAKRGDLFAVLLRQEGFQIFIRAQLCFGGTWRQRLRRLWDSKLLNFDSDDVEDRLDYGARWADEFSRLLGNLRPEIAARSRNLSDAAAMASMARMLETGHNREIRFYTETAKVQEAFASGLGKACLSTQVAGQSSPILRTAEYFLIRCSFAALQLPGAVQQSDDSVTLKELDDLQAELGELATEPASEHIRMEVLRRRYLGDLPLVELIPGFFELKFVRSFVNASLVGADLDVLLPGLGDLLEGDESLQETTSVSLDRELEGLEAQIRKGAERLRRFRLRFEMIAAAMAERREQFGGNVPRLATDVGLGRWGLLQEIHCRENVENWVRELVLGDELGVAISAGVLAQKLEADLPSSTEREEILVQLWILGRWDLVEAAWLSWSGDDARPIAFEVLYLVSMVKDERPGPVTTTPRWEKIRRSIKRSEQLASHSQQLRKGYRLMTLAHVCYWAWRVSPHGFRTISEQFGGEKQSGETGASDFDSRSELEAAQWAEKSFSAARDASKLLAMDGLAQAFALNHCCYMGYVCNIFPAETSSAWHEINQRFRQFHSHYRFADTLALAFSLRAFRSIRLHGLEALLEEDGMSEQRKRVKENLGRAKELLEASRPFFGDEEVVAHYGAVCESLEWFEDKNG